MSNIIYIGPMCPRCVNTNYTVMVLGGKQYKKCVECGRISPVVDGELTQKPAE